MTIDLSNFTGTEAYHSGAFPPTLLHTDGVKYLVETAKAHWLVDISSRSLPP